MTEEGEVVVLEFITEVETDVSHRKLLWIGIPPVRIGQLIDTRIK